MFQTKAIYINHIIIELPFKTIFIFDSTNFSRSPVLFMFELLRTVVFLLYLQHLNRTGTDFPLEFKI